MSPMNDAVTTTKKLSKKAAAAEIAAILRRVGGGVDIEALCAEVAEEVEKERRQARQLAKLRRTYQPGEVPGETWEDFVREAVGMGEWDEEWGMPTQA